MNNLFLNIKTQTPNFRFTIKIKINIFKDITNPKHMTFKFIKTVKLYVK